MTATSDEAFACDLTTLSDDERERLSATSTALFAAADAVRALDDGFAVGFRAVSPQRLAQLADFVALDRLCCPFLRHAVVVSPHGGPAWLELSAPGATAFLAAELRPLLPERLASELVPR